MRLCSPLSKKEILFNLNIHTKPHFDAKENDIVLYRINQSVYTLHQKINYNCSIPRQLKLFEVILFPMVLWIKITEKDNRSEIHYCFFWDYRIIACIGILFGLCSLGALIRYPSFVDFRTYMLGLSFLISIPLIISLIVNIYGKDYIDSRQYILTFFRNCLCRRDV